MIRLTQWPDGWRILCLRPDNLGDVLMTTPAFRALKLSFPRSHLTLLTSSVGSAVASMIPEIDALITFDVPWVGAPGSGAGEEESDPALVYRMTEQLRNHSFDAAIIFTVQSQNPLPTAMLCYMAGIPRVLSYCRENPYRLISDWVPDPEVLVATRHEVIRQLDLVATVGAHTTDRHLSLHVPPAARAQARQALQTAGVDLLQPWIVLHPGVSEEKRRYPADAFAAAGRQLIQEQGLQVVLTGSSSEQAYAESIRQQMEPGHPSRRVFNLAGTFDLPTFAGLIGEAPVLLSNNTGPVHIAAAVGTPVVVLYAKTNPQHTPWEVPSRVLYFDVPAHLRSRNTLLQQFPEPTGSKASPEAIVRAVEALLVTHSVHSMAQSLNHAL